VTMYCLSIEGMSWVSDCRKRNCPCSGEICTEENIRIPRCNCCVETSIHVFILSGMAVCLICQYLPVLFVYCLSILCPARLRFCLSLSFLHVQPPSECCRTRFGSTCIMTLTPLRHNLLRTPMTLCSKTF